MMNGMKRFVAASASRKIKFAVVGIVMAMFLTTAVSANPSFRTAQVLLGIQTRDKIFALDFRDKNQGMVVGDTGFITSTKDGGTTWTRYKDKEIGYEPLFDVCLVGAKAGWIVGKKGVILRTKDGGASWEKLKSGTKSDLMAVRFINEKQGIAAGSYGTILQTFDGGETWQPFVINWEKELKSVMERNGLASPHLYDICFVGNKGWIVGENGVILHSSDNGRTWNLSQGGLLPPLFSVSFKNQNEGWAVGQNGYAVQTRDGKTWQRTNLNIKESLFRIRVNHESGFIVGEFGTVLTTRDGGKTWTSRLEQDRETMIGICLLGEAKEAIVAGAKTIRKLVAEKK